MMHRFDPIESLADARHEFGEHGGVNLSIEASTTYTFMHADTIPSVFRGRLGPERGCYLYGRHFNPTVGALGRQLAALEDTETAYCTASGMSAIATAVMQQCEAGDHVVASHTLYGGTFALLEEFLPARTGIRTTFVDVADHRAVAAAFTDRTRVLYTESMANPTLAVADVPALARIAHDRDALLIVDNTFSPIVLSPARLGADIVVHSLTKFISGASDIIGGCVCGDEAFVKRLMDLHTGAIMLLGPTMDPIVAFRLATRIPHLGLRMAEHSRRALEFSSRLEELGLPVIYPGLPSHPDHELMARLHDPDYGFGGIIALDLGDEETANQFMERLQNEARFGYMAVSLGFHDTLMSCSGSSTSSELGEEAKRRAGISPGLVRMSIGYTGSVEQRWSQLSGVLHDLGKGKEDRSIPRQAGIK